MSAATIRTTEAERDEARFANRGGFAFLAVHGVTWLIAGASSYVLPVEQAALVYLFQGLVAFPLSLGLERLLGFRFIRTADNSIVELFVLIALTQGLALPASIVAFNLEPLTVPVVFAATNGGHFLPYAWLHRTRAYAVLAAVAAVGPFALLVVLDAEPAFHATGFLVGATMLATAAWVLRRTS
jgi:hypothetical protein